MPKYQQPDWFTQHVVNGAIAFVVKRLGLTLPGMTVLAVRGRKSGQWRETPVNVLSLDGERYLVAPRGETQWVRNLRAGSAAELRRGGRSEPIRAEELPDDRKPPILRAYLQRWHGQVGQFFEVGPNAVEDELRRIAPDHPSFRITPPGDSSPG